MNKKKPAFSKRTARMKRDDLRPGDRVRVRIAFTTYHARVIEDRGPIGIRGRQIVLIEIRPGSADEGEVRRLEWPAEELVRESSAA